MHLFGSPYHRDKDGFVSKAFGLAKLGAIVTAGIVAKPYLGSFLAAGSERFVSKFADAIEGASQIADFFDRGEALKPRSSEGNFIRRMFQLGGKNQNARNAFMPTLDSEAIAGSEVAEGIQTVFASASVARARTSAFMDALVDGHVLSGDLSEGSTARRILAGRLGFVGKAQEVSDFRKITTSSAMAQFRATAEELGITFKPGFAENQRDIFSNILRDHVGPIQPHRPGINAAIHTGQNAETIANAMIGHMDAMKEKTDLSRRLFYPKSKELTIGDLEKAAKDKQGPIYKQLEHYLGSTRQSNTTGDSHLEEALNSIKGDMEKLFSPTVEGVGQTHPELDRVLARWRQSRSGYIVTREGKVVNLTQQSNIRKGLSEYITSDSGLGLQIPIFPGLMDVPVGIFKFAKPDAQTVKRLGMLTELPELMRHRELGQLYAKDTQTQALALGDRLLTLSGGELVDHSSKYRVSATRTKGIHSSGAARRLRDVRSSTAEYTLDDAMHFKPNAGHAWFDTLAYNNIDSLGEVVYNPHQSSFGINSTKAAKPFLNRLYGSNLGKVDVEKLPPGQLLAYLLKDNNWANLAEGESANPALLGHALQHIIHQAASAPNSMGFLKTLNMSSARGKWLNPLLKLSEDPEAFAEYLQAGHLPAIHDLIGEALKDGKIPDHALIDSELFGGMNRKLQPHLFRAFTSVSDDVGLLYGVSGKEGGAAAVFKNKWFGKSNIGKAMGNFQKGLLGEYLAQTSIDDLGGKEPLEKLLLAARGAITGDGKEDNLISLLKGTELGKKLGIGSRTGYQTSEIVDMIHSVVHQESSEIGGVITTKDVIHERKMGELAIALNEQKRLLGIAKTDVFGRAKITEQYALAVDSLDINTSRKNALLAQMANDAHLTGVLQDRFRFGHPWTPEMEAMDPLNSSSWHATLSTGPGLQDFINDPLGTFAHTALDGFGAKEFFSSLIDPSRPLGPLASTIQILASMPQEIAEKVGLGLTAQDRVTTLRTVASFYGKRILPIVGAHYAYRGLNHGLHAAGLNGIDDLGANLFANVNLLGARLKDLAGMTEFNQSLVNRIPGLDQYFSPRSEDEYRDHLYYGEEEVREGRLWFFGSRSPATGGRIKYVRPSFYRRWKSHWMDDDLSDSWDPESPYNQNAKSKRRLIDNPNSLTINSGGAGGYTSIGEFGFGLPTSLGGGGDNMQFGSYESLHGGTGSQGGGGGRGVGGPAGVHIPGEHLIGGGGGDAISIGYNRGYINANGFDPLAFVKAPIRALKRMSGLYGAAISRLPGYPGDGNHFNNQDPNAGHSFRRTMFLGDYGELGTLNIGEFFRRFVGADNQALDAPSQLTNNMPGWMGDKFATGNPYLRTPGIGELNLPGPAYERANPWVKNLRVRGSSVGYSEEELIRKWLNPMEPLDGADADDIVAFGCVDTETEILTKEGWKVLGQFKEGDLILTLNHETGLTEWHPIEYINKYWVGGRDLISIETQYHSSLTTPNHKWPVIKQYQKRTNNLGESFPERWEREWTTSDKLTSALNHIILSAKYSDFPTMETYSDDFVKLLAWYWTEGATQNGLISICQSKKVNMPYVEEIRAILENLFGPQTPNMKIANPNKLAMWAEYDQDLEKATFRLNVHASKSIIELAPNKIISLDFIYSLTEAQLNIFIETSIKADGKRSYTIGQSDPNRLKAIELACLLLGKSINRYESEWIYRYKDNERIAKEYILSFPDRELLGFRRIREKVTKKFYKGTVWCPTVKNATWCARRKGKVFYTGNSTVHLNIQRQMSKYGILVGAETSVYDEEHNISGTIDAITRGPNGYELLDIKTQGSKSWGTTPEKYIDQITAYMAITGIKQGHLVFVNRDDPSQIRVENYAFDPARWRGITDRIDRARAAVNQMVEKGTISPYETYDLLTRIDILSKVAPGSPEYRKAVQFAEESGGFGGFEKDRFEEAKRRAKRLSQTSRTYPYRYGVPTESQSLFIEDIGPNGEIITEMGTVKLAGVKFDKQAFINEDPESVLAKYGIVPGRMTNMTFVEGQFNPDTMADTSTDVIIGNANRKLIKAGIGHPDLDAKNPLAYKVLYGDSFMGKMAEKLLHSDNIISNKFLRVRSPLEQFERGEVYGIDHADWNDPIGTIIEPTISSMAHKNPITASLQTAFIASLFFGTTKGKLVGSGTGAIVGLTASLAAKAFDLFTGKTWTPSRYNKQTEFDEYWDTLEFVKYSTIAEAAKHKAKKEEGTDIDALESSDDREAVALGPWGTMAVWANRKARNTMYGYDENTGSLQSALSVIPGRHQQIAEEIINTGSLSEKRKFYNMLPDSEKRVLGKFLNADEVPNKPNLTAYFKQHYLPDSNWQGWNARTNDEDLKARAAANEELIIERPTRSRIEKARAYTGDVPIPRMDHPTYAWVNARIQSIIRDGGLHGVTAEASFTPSDYSSVNVDMDLFEDQTPQLMEKIRRSM